ncbi:MAG: hypothetical protein ACK56I_34865, partial [bacterium]
FQRRQAAVGQHAHLASQDVSGAPVQARLGAPALVVEEAVVGQPARAHLRLRVGPLVGAEAPVEARCEGAGGDVVGLHVSGRGRLPIGQPQVVGVVEHGHGGPHEPG